MNIYDYKVKDNEGKDIPLAKYKGMVLLIVNTATGCGFTPQYEGLEKLYEEFHKYGFEILDFPCNQFGHQAPGSDKDIQTFCTLRYNTTFPRFQKVKVNGREASPLFKWLKKQKRGFLTSSIKWNFTKFLIDREGKVVGRYSPTVTPGKLEVRIRELLDVESM